VDGKAQAAAVRRKAFGLLLIAAGLLLLAAAVPASSPQAAGSATGVGPDFNGDGLADLAVGVPHEGVNGIESTGAVEVIYGSSTGLNGDAPIDDQFWNKANIEASTVIPKRYDDFGFSLASGDFDGDGFDELAIGVPLEDVVTSTGELKNAGAVYVLDGSPTGLGASASVWTQSSSRIFDFAEKDDQFGTSLAAGDFGWGPEDDLAIGVPAEDLGSIGDAGAVNVIYGSSSGLNSRGNEFWSQSSEGVPDRAERYDSFGQELLAADLGRTEEDDLVVGVVNESFSGAAFAGAVNVIYGFPNHGLSGRGAQFLSANSRGVPGIAHYYDHFGSALAAGDFGRSDDTDLAIGAPDENKGKRFAGAVYVLYGSSTRIRTANAQIWSQGSAGVEGDPEEYDSFGSALAAADFGKGPRADLAVGVPGEDEEGHWWEATPGAGAVNVLYGRSSGLSGTGSDWWWQDSSGFNGAVEGSNNAYQWFGDALAAADFGKGPGADLAVGVPGEDGGPRLFPEPYGIGGVNVLYSDERGLRASDDQFWSQASDSLHDSAEALDEFGAALAR
jgi:FG-GAP repeat